MTDKTSIEDRIYILMKERKVTQKSVAAAIGIPQQRLNDFLKKRRPMRAALILPICEAIGCEPNELFGYAKEKQQSAQASQKFVPECADGRAMGACTTLYSSKAPEEATPACCS